MADWGHGDSIMIMSRMKALLMGCLVTVAACDTQMRDDADTFYVLEDNARTPSGVSYML